MVDTGDKETDDLIHEIWRDAGVYNEDCYDGKSDVNLKNCSYGCYTAHVTGSVNTGGKCDTTQPCWPSVADGGPTLTRHWFS